jgi:transcriptional regulator with XRE-family HTH domain
MFKLPKNRKWYEELALLEGEHEVSAGYIDPVLDDVPEDEEVQQIKAEKVAADTRPPETRRAFARVVRELRLDKKLSYDALSNRLDVDVDELRYMEEDASYRAAPRTLIQMADFYAIPKPTFLTLAGAVRETDDLVEEEAVKFAANSAEFDVLSKEQKKMLHDFVRFLREGHKERTRQG